MTILSGDIKLVASQVMLDVENGGGAPSAIVINDGASNGIFPDISELDRAGGRVNLRKVFPSVQTTNSDGYFGANVIVAEPPDDPNVSVSLFSTQDVFDRRESAKSRMEAYLAQGPIYPGVLFGDHIAGMAVVTVLQREEIALPVVGDTFVLRAFEGTGGQVEQFVRVTDVASLLRTFTDANGDYKRMQVTLDISDVLRFDFPGHEATRFDSSISYVGKTKFYATIVADAARYYGAVPLEVAAEIGDFIAKGETIFTQLVPSTRIEVPIADARMNQQLSMLTAAGSTISRVLTSGFTTSQALFIGGSILPGSLTVVRSGITLNDKGGLLMNTGSQVGTVDYDNGVLTLSTDVFGASAGSHTVTYTPALAPTVVNESLGLPVTQQGQRLSWIVTLDPVPAKRTLQVSYRALGRWYVLSEDGSGAIRGADSAFGAGTLNYTTGTVSVTLGALPDVESRVILTWAPAAAVQPSGLAATAGPSLTRAFGKQINLIQSIKPGTLTLSWNDGSAKSATDSQGVLVGDATGNVRYGAGQIVFRPNTLPAKNTLVTLTLTEAAQAISTVASMTDSGANWTFGLGALVKPYSVSLSIVAEYPLRQFPGIDETSIESIAVFDDGAGNLQISNITGNLTIGSINYSTGACSIGKTAAGFKSNQSVWQVRTPLAAAGDPSSNVKLTGYETRTLTLTFINGPGGATPTPPTWAWWAGSQSVAVQYRIAQADGVAFTTDFLFDQIFMPAHYVTVYGYNGLNTEETLAFNLGSKRHEIRRYNGKVYADIFVTTGEGTEVGDYTYYNGAQGSLLNTWQAGVSSAPTDVAGAAPPDLISRRSSLKTDSVTFRTAVAPLLNGGFSIAGSYYSPVGALTSFNVNADNAGLINSGSAPASPTAYGSFGVFGIVDYEMGVVDLRFGRRVGATAAASAIGMIDISELGIPGVTQIQAVGVNADDLRYNAVGYAYLPLDPEILGLDPVRLPADGRVPIFRAGTFAVIGHTGTVGPANVSNGQVINCARNRLSRVRVIGNNGTVINTGYSVDLEAGLVTFVDVTGYSQPVTVEHRIEDMMLVSDAQINGQLSFTRALTHDYPVGSVISSALIAGDMTSRVSLIFDQSTWNNSWSDIQSGSAATGTFNDALNPIGVSNRGTLTERWAVVFTNSTSFNVIGEHVGVIATGTTGVDCSPLNPATSTPYFTIPAAGWGLGWATGNVMRFNTVGAFYPVWVARTILQGPETVPDDSFTILIRGDVDRP